MAHLKKNMLFLAAHMSDPEPGRRTISNVFPERKINYINLWLSGAKKKTPLHKDYVKSSKVYFISEIQMSLLHKVILIIYPIILINLI